MISKDDAIRTLQKILTERQSLPNEVTNSSVANSVWDGWMRTTEFRIRKVFGQSSQLEEVRTQLKPVRERAWTHDKYRLSESLVPLIESLILEVTELWEDAPSVGLTQSPGTEPAKEHDKSVQSEPLTDKASDHVFVVHGHDHGRLQTVARFLERLKLRVVILHERPSEGATIIEKLESHGNASFAVILLTPDDVGSTASQANDLKPRARQNVVLELGYFLGRLGRRRVAALVSEGVELPSDYSGVVYIDFDDRGTWQLSLAKELRAAGLPIDTGALF